MQVTIVLEDRNSNLDYFDFDLDKNFNEARAFYFQNELDVFENYLYETDFFYNIPEHIHHYIDIEKVRRDYYFIDIYSTDVFEQYLFIFE